VANKNTANEKLRRASRIYAAGNKIKRSAAILTNLYKKESERKTSRLTRSKHARAAHELKLMQENKPRLRRATDRLKELRYKKALTLTRGAAKLHPKFSKRLKGEFSPRFLYRNIK
jgi:hypothetical protein